MLGKQAMAYSNLFEKQIKRIKIEGVPFNQNDYFYTFEIFYNHVSADASIELIFDLLERNGILVNDVHLRNYLVLAENLDYEIPRTKIGIYKLKK